MPVGQGRLQSPGPVRLLHRAGSTASPGWPASPRFAGSRADRVTTLEGLDEELRQRWAAGLCRHAAPASAASARRASCAPGRPRAARRRSTRRRRRVGAAGPPVPLHRLADPSSRPACLALGVDEDRPPVADFSVRVTRCCASWRAADRGSALPGLGARRRARWRGLRRRHRPGRCAGQARCRAPSGPDLAAARVAAGSVQGRNSTVPLTHPVETAGGDVGAHPADDLGRAGLSSSPTQVGASPGATPPRPWPTGGRSGPSVRSPVPEAARRLADEPGRRSGSYGAAKTWCATAPSAPRSPWRCAADGTGILRVGRTPGQPTWRPLRRGWAPSHRA